MMLRKRKCQTSLRFYEGKIIMVALALFRNVPLWQSGGEFYRARFFNQGNLGSFFTDCSSDTSLCQSILLLYFLSWVLFHFTFELTDFVRILKDSQKENYIKISWFFKVRKCIQSKLKSALWYLWIQGNINKFWLH